LVVGLRSVRTRRGDTLMIVTLDDRTARLDVTVFSDLLADCRELLTEDALVVVEGEVSFDEFSNGLKMRAYRVESLEHARQQSASGVRITLDQVEAGFANTLMARLNPYQGGECPVVIAYNTPEATGEVVLGESHQVHPSDALLLDLQDLLGADRVQLEFATRTTQR